MELEFEKQEFSCLRKVTGDTVSGEQTQEVRLPEGMPDASSVVAAWGQVLLRGKEWRSGGMHVSGGVMAWVLYSAEDSWTLHCVDAWLPFQMKWDFPDPGRDGRICAWGRLQSIDARCLSARKLMLRTNVTLCGQGYVKDIQEIPQAGELPEDIALKMPTYPMRLIKEVGEHAFTLEEMLSVPDMDGCAYYTVEPVIAEQRVMGDKLVFRGDAKVHMLCMKDGELESWDGELPFSQFCDLEGSYEQDGEGYILPAMTAMELEKGEDGWVLKCGITCQYIITDRKILIIPEDSYSTQRTVKLHHTETEIPCVLQQESHSLPVSCKLPCEGARIIDGSVCPGHGMLDRSENCYIMPLWGQLLYADPEGKVKSESCRWEEKMPLSADDGVRPGIYGEMESFRWTLSPDCGELQGEMRLQELTDVVSNITVLSGMEMGEAEKKDPNRPSLILRRLGQDSLWDVAKSCRTTVSAIQDANAITDDCASDKMLIIPIS